MSQDIKREVDRLVKEINNVTFIKKIYLFGSFAYGNPNDDSDIDLCILTNLKRQKKNIFNSIGNKGLETSLFLYKKTQWN